MMRGRPKVEISKEVWFWEDAHDGIAEEVLVA